MEVIYAIMKIENISFNEVEIAREQKNKMKGSFKDKVYLINVEQEQIDEREEKYNNDEKIKKELLTEIKEIASYYGTIIGN